jgi:hypothetical protein
MENDTVHYAGVLVAGQQAYFVLHVQCFFFFSFFFLFARRYFNVVKR